MRDSAAGARSSDFGATLEKNFLARELPCKARHQIQLLYGILGNSHIPSIVSHFGSSHRAWLEFSFHPFLKRDRNGRLLLYTSSWGSLRMLLRMISRKRVGKLLLSTTRTKSEQRCAGCLNHNLSQSQRRTRCSANHLRRSTSTTRGASWL